MHAVTHAVLAVLQSWLGRDQTAMLVVVTRGAVGLAGQDVTDLAGAAVWGLVRSAQAEHPGRIVLLDTDIDIDLDGGPDASIDWIGLAGLGEPQLVVRAGVAYGGRLAAVAPVLELPQPGVGWRLAAGGGGTFEDVVVAPCPQALAPLQAGQVRVDVRAVGVNFRDVLVALGMVPGQDPVLGGEGAGVVLEVGAGVTGVGVGDAVLGLLGGVGAVAVVDARMLARVPSGWSFAEAAGVPVVFLTAWYGLADLAGLGAGESVLVHAATGFDGVVRVGGFSGPGCGGIGVGACRYRRGGDGRGPVGPVVGCAGVCDREPR
ncbi:SpnB-like Rossmann fold domain-containing protein [Mycobacterium riyadhense]|uniref:SpnB-like Rossmann fold domain-containing protein n=1 Tax=Mycobacterium riyadhense TaxID=486698 RepID=UPI0021F31573|nr:alcohol dehydrogenase catalytic domain-containing protein [Mycobacterium riyadhense]